MRWLLNVIFGRRNVARITKDLARMVNHLEAHAEKMGFEIDRHKADTEAALVRHQQELDDLQSKINDAVSEKDKAAKIATNVKDLLQ